MEIGNYKIRRVPGEKIRKISPIYHEFGNSAIHEDFPKLIPYGEIWIDEIISPQEQVFLIINSLTRYKLINNKVPSHLAYKAAIKKERAERSKVDGINFKGKTFEKPPVKIYMRLYKDLWDVKVWNVSGQRVRDLYKTDFIEGGHHYVYPWIPESEIWIDDFTDKKEKPQILVHEFIERKLMKEKHLSYNKAHLIAAREEFKREHNFTYEDLDSLDDIKVKELL